jgi:hypothetical protein
MTWCRVSGASKRAPRGIVGAPEHKAHKEATSCKTVGVLEDLRQKAVPQMGTSRNTEHDRNRLGSLIDRKKGNHASYEV